MKTCPICSAKAFDDARICYGCMYSYDSASDAGEEESPLDNTTLEWLAPENLLPQWPREDPRDVQDLPIEEASGAAGPRAADVDDAVGAAGGVGERSAPEAAAGDAVADAEDQAVPTTAPADAEGRAGLKAEDAAVCDAAKDRVAPVDEVPYDDECDATACGAEHFVPDDYEEVIELFDRRPAGCVFSSFGRTGRFDNMSAGAMAGGAAGDRSLGDGPKNPCLRRSDPMPVVPACAEQGAVRREYVVRLELAWVPPNAPSCGSPDEVGVMSSSVRSIPLLMQDLG
ncbi:hypothetical protein [Xiamenia xianingshaonis]|uniref:Uncharacterized protein n=1 Tax=Xiamenia xianingshaonis TaxID=2682776 RepID=A0A9E6MP88_9ACTN|nr:hypothetical protein [Xiamenia xianingshaonis]NHM14036.1 hypothetical protein [Xiamenia xianingshaonis]QTU83909.1 hypothetical protein J7S26_05910 [Xiamenia xianingshaonis]